MGSAAADGKGAGTCRFGCFPCKSCLLSVCTCRASCWQPGARTPSSPGVSEDCLYLNVFVPQNMVSAAALKTMFALKTAPLEIPSPRAASTVRPALSWWVLGFLRPEWLRASLGPPRPHLISRTGARAWLSGSGPLRSIHKAPVTGGAVLSGRSRNKQISR